MKLQQKNKIEKFFEELSDKSKKINAYPIEDEELQFILNNFITYLKKKNKKFVEILEIGGGIGNFTLKFSFELVEKGFSVEYFSIEKNKEKIKIFKRNIEKFREIIENKELLKLLKIKLIENDALDTLKNFLKIQKCFDLILIDANKKKYKEYFLLSLKLTDFIVIDDIFFKAKNKRTKNIENYLKNFLNYLENIKDKDNLNLKYLKKGFGLVIVEKTNRI